MDLDYNRLLSDAALDMASEPAIVTTLERVVELCHETLTRCSVAGVSVVEAGRIRTLVASRDALRRIDEIQSELQEGPVFDALRHHESVASDSVDVDERWPRWGSRVSEELGLRGFLAYRLFMTGDSLGVLQLYANPGAFAPEDLLEGQVLAAHASVALAATFKESQLHRALESRTVIGQATGILIERFSLTPDQAFAVMRRVSQNHNTKVHDLARHLVETGVLFDPPSAPTAKDEAAEPES
jgi:hypothetical protein